MSSPWLKFFPTDWRADPALRMCSLAARGLWMEMLCVMHEAEPYGTLRVNGRAVTDRQLTALAGGEVEALLAELEEAGVFSRESDGTIYSRRMQRDAEKAARDKANGKGGGNPSLKMGVNPPDKAQKPEARSQKEEAQASSKRAQTASAFEAWYQHYPHKVQRGAAERAFSKAIELTSLDELVDGLRRYVSTKPDDRHWQNPATWLNGKGWLDEPAGPPIRNPGIPPPRPTGANIWTSEAKTTGLIDEPTSTTTGRMGTGYATGHHRGPVAVIELAVTSDRTGH